MLIEREVNEKRVLLFSEPMTMEPLAIQEVLYIEQKIEWTEKFTVEHIESMKLFDDRILVFDQEYYLNHIFDISYRQESCKMGFLYLHTSKGVRTYYIRKDPSSFIQAFKQQQS